MGHKILDFELISDERESVFKRVYGYNFSL